MNSRLRASRVQQPVAAKRKPRVIWEVRTRFSHSLNSLQCIRNYSSWNRITIGILFQNVNNSISSSYLHSNHDMMGIDLSDGTC